MNMHGGMGVNMQNERMESAQYETRLKARPTPRVHVRPMNMHRSMQVRRAEDKRILKEEADARNRLDEPMTHQRPSTVP